MKDPGKYDELAAKGFLPAGMEILRSSDAHTLSAVGEDLSRLGEDSRLRYLLDRQMVKT